MGKKCKIVTPCSPSCRVRVRAGLTVLMENGVRKEHTRGKMRSVSTQGINGTRGKLKIWLASEGGSYTDHVFGLPEGVPVAV